MKSKRMTGKELQKAIVDLAHVYGWRCAHFQSVLATRKDGSASWRTPVAADGKGFPDLFMVRGNRAIAAEVKGDGDALRDDQRQWLEDLDAAHIHTCVWTPSDWRDGIVEAQLR